MLEEVVIVAQSSLNALAKLILAELERQNLSQRELARRASGCVARSPASRTGGGLW